MKMLLPILIPILVGVILPLLKLKNRKVKLSIVALSLVAELAAALFATSCDVSTFELVRMTDSLSVALRVDDVSRIFTWVVTGGFLLAGVYSFIYMKHEENEDRFFSFFLLSEAMLVAMSFSDNLVTMYLFYEMVTLLSMPMVLHSMKKEAVSAALKYLFYSLGGALLALLGIFFLGEYTTTLTFTAGGALDAAKLLGHENLLLVIVFLATLGFGTKAGLYPMHGWLPTAHPVAPAPASAVLSGVITNAGVLAILRMLFYVVGADFIRGTWVQTTLLILALLTVFMGSMMAYREKIFKKRLAYSTVSQISYILVGLFLMTEQSVSGALLHVIFHAAAKVALFLVAGAIIYKTGKTRVDEVRGIGKKMPVTMFCFVIASLTLIGIPPTGGFISKWYLAAGALESGLGAFTYIAPIVLLVSALLTAGYLLPVAVDAFFPGREHTDELGAIKEEPLMYIPLIVLCILAVVFGLVSSGLVDLTKIIALPII